MFGLSLPKILFTAVLVAAVLIGFRFLSRRGAEDGNKSVTNDTRRCAVCGDFVAAESAENCERKGCPYR